jgi:hypothetical protein
VNAALHPKELLKKYAIQLMARVLRQIDVVI